MVTMVRKERESTESLIRRFTRKIVQTGMLREVRSKRFSTKKKSREQMRAEAIYKAKMQRAVDRLKKMGNYSPQAVRELRKRLKKEGQL